MSAGRGFGLNEDRKPITVISRTRVLMTQEEVEALHVECTAALREWDEERAQELHEIQEAESSDRPPLEVRIPNQGAGA
jgi:hypothetical protein